MKRHGFYLGGLRVLFSLVVLLVAAVPSASSQRGELLLDGVTASQNIAHDFIQSVMKTVADLDYDTSKEVRLAVPGTDQELVFSWGFIGSGDLFSPMPNVSAEIKIIDKEASDESFAYGFGKIVLKNEILKRGKKNLPLIKWLQDSHLSPVKIFALKVLMLCKDIPKLGLKHVQSEVMRLLFRLSLNSEFGIFDKNKKLTSYFPEILTRSLDVFGLEVLELIDQTWAAFIEDEKALSLEHIAKGSFADLNAYVFKNKVVAQKYYDILKTRTMSSGEFEALILDHNDEVVSFEEFEKYAAKKEPVMMADRLGKLGYVDPRDRLVGKRSLGCLNLESENSAHFEADLPVAVIEDLKKSMNKNARQQAVIMKQDYEGNTWIAFASPQLNTAQTLRLMTLTCSRAFREYINAREKVTLSKNVDGLKYRELTQKREGQQRAVARFLKTERGQASKKRLDKVLEALDKEFSQSQNVSEKNGDSSQDTLAKLKTEREERKIKLIETSARLSEEKKKNTHKLHGLVIEQLVKQLERTCVELASEISVYNQKIKQLEASLSTDRVQIMQQSQEEKIETYVKQRDKLLTIERENKSFASAETLSKLREQIENLTVVIEKFRELTQDQTQNNLIRDFVQLYKSRAHAYKQEEQILYNAVKAEEQELETIRDEYLKAARKLELDLAHEHIDSYRAHLITQAQACKEKSAKLKNLAQLKKRLERNKEDEMLKKQIEELECELSDVLSVSGYTYLAKMVSQSPEVKSFCEDLQSDIPEFKVLRQNFVESLSWIAQNSEHLRENKSVYRYLIKSVAPNFVSHLDKVDA